jgi:dipeptidyl aminopeptidase/acylaminoacyl peptidase
MGVGNATRLLRLVAFPVRIGLGVAPVLLAMAAASCGGGNSSSEPPSTSVVATTPAEAPQTPVAETACLLDPTRAGGEVASINWSTRAVRLEDSPGKVTTVIPAYQTGKDYVGEAYTLPALSPSGTKLVVGANFKQGDGTSQAGLWEIDLPDLRRTLLLPSDNGATFDVDAPAFSPDGAQLAFTRVNVKWLPTHGHADTYEVWIMGTDGSNPHKVADGATPYWSNDGKLLSFAQTPGANSPQVVVDTQQFETVPGMSLPTCTP